MRSIIATAALLVALVAGVPAAPASAAVPAPNVATASGPTDPSGGFEWIT